MNTADHSQPDAPIEEVLAGFAAALQADLAAFRPRQKPTLDDFLQGLHPLDPSWRRAELKW